MTGVLEGIRVLDFGRYIAAPFCGALLADLGAEVIRIDREGGNEDRWVNPVTDREEGALFLQVNRNKKGITLDITSPEGRADFNDLLATADVVITNLPVAALQELGLDYDSLVRIKPDIIATNVSTFGPSGPFRDRVGFDGLAQAMSGAMHMTGDGITPTRTGVPWVDFGTAFCATIGTLAALLEKKKSGKGQKVEAALLHTALTVASGYLVEQALIAPNYRAIVNRALTSGPNDCFKMKDGWLLVAIVGNPMFKRWCKLIGEPELVDDARFKSDKLRGDNGELLSEKMQRWCTGRTVAEAMAELDKGRVPCAPALSLQQALDHPHVLDGGFLKAVAHPDLKQAASLVTTPFRLSRTPASIRHRAPLLDEHADELVREPKARARRAAKAKT
jgi:crotonobetainyl-CoA:carnitine CoA-transferase CaiB-like acyl-CoA transferase